MSSYSNYRCGYCGIYLASVYALKCHISDKHKYDTSTDQDEGETSQPKTIDEEENPNLWDDDELLPTISETDIWRDDEEIGHYDDDILVVRLR